MQDTSLSPELIELSIEKAVTGGEGLARLEGQVVFVQGALPGERVRARVISHKRDFRRAQTVEILEPSPFRQTPPCPWALSCGGCDLQHATRDGQLRMKQDILLDTLRRIGGVTEIPDASRGESGIKTFAGDPWEYRSRARLHVDPSTGAIGYRERGSDQIVSVNDCPVLTSPLRTLLTEQRDRILDAALSWARAQDSRDRRGNRPIDRYRCELPIAANDHAAFLGDQPFDQTLGDHHFPLTPDMFFQANRPLMERLLTEEIGHCEGSLAMDLYAGSGVFSAALESGFDRIIAVERDDRCLEAARSHLSEKTEFYTGDVLRWAKKHAAPSPDLVVTDPPRTGLDAGVVQALVSWQPEQILYVSCDPVTLARDLRRFLHSETGGYRLELVHLYDFYPQTSHMESVTLLRRK